MLVLAIEACAAVRARCRSTDASLGKPRFGRVAKARSGPQPVTGYTEYGEFEFSADC